MKTLIIVILILVFVGCNLKKDQDKTNSVTDFVAPKGLFTATLGGKQYKVEIECSYFNEDYFKFQSDKTDLTDSNGDGLIISGFQKGKKLVLTIINRSKKFSAANIIFTKANNTASGGGKLFEEGGNIKGFEIVFKVACQ